MSFEDLDEHGLFLPEDVWGEIDLHTSVNVYQLAATGLLGLGACLMMWLGHGNTLTWVGAGLFFVFMYAFTYVSNAGIEEQNDEIDQLKKRSQEQETSERAT